MTVYLDLDDLLLVAARAVADDCVVRDYGLLGAAVARPKTTVAGSVAYPDIYTKAGALLHSLCRNRALLDGNQRLAWIACQVFLGLNGEWVTASEDDRFNLMVAVASGVIDDVDEIAAQLRTWCG
ncbi:type II toxin-antitoxin system death-on-curing family toxin [Mycolicibacterium celeriflavum]|uniref:Toxin Doc n=1 Tax=Mycolicibacterium celeriflavum TaxID=1249101 RepID=A0A1X0BR54_MYCCF|nr:Fic family protein [Mycolicibacterium celeriflavum]MCV7240388.1 Fic family protein [Mycolicibacterium celeriflavum]ORA45207.1 death-on-curing protein [Mycolicibacterium celeriflavum]BBY44129.1 toxin Doc [Mycolicibacterium celeriflavum]